MFRLPGNMALDVVRTRDGDSAFASDERGGRALSEDGSGEEDEPDQERSQNAGGSFTLMMIFFGKSGGDVFTPNTLKQMCEVENLVLSMEDYGKVCFNSTTTATSTYTTAGDGSNCTLPFLSPVSLFYRLWDDSVHPVADVRSALATVRTALSGITTVYGAFGTGSTARSAWWTGNPANVQALKTAVEAASTAARPLNPGTSGWTTLVDSIDAYATNLPLNTGYATMGSASELTVSGNPTLYSLIQSVETALAYTGDLSDEAINNAELWSGMPFSGVLPGAPIKGTYELVGEDEHTRKCELLDAEYVEARAAQLFELAHQNAELQNTVGFFISSTSLSTNSTNITRSIIDFGKPRMAPYESDDELEAWMKGLEAKMLNYFGMEAGFLYSPYRSPAATADLDVRYMNAGWTGDEFSTIINNDFLMVIAAMLFVWLYIMFHTSSFPLASLGMLQIFLSIPLALFVYTVPFPFFIYGARVTPYFAQVHILAIFICLGVGADDIFVFMDAWRQSGNMPSMKTLAARMEYTYERTFVSVLNTSATTAIAFLATGFASIMPIASFGVFAAFAIMFNWVLTVTWWPCAVMIWEVFFCRARGIGCCFTCCGCENPCFIKDQTSHPYFDPNGKRSSVACLPEQPEANAAKAAEAPADKAEGEMGGLSMSERVFHDFYAPMLNYHVGPKGPAGLAFKPCSVILVIAFGSLGAYLTSEALTLTTPDETPVWFPADHMTTGLSDLIRENFLAGEDDDYIQGNLYFGLAGVSAPDYNQWSPNEKRGNLILDGDFDITKADAQTAFLQLCDDLEVEDCKPAGGTAPMAVCQRPPYRLLSEDTLKCFLRDFRSERITEGYSGLPTGPDFHREIHRWMTSEYGSKGSDYWGDVGFVNGTVQWAKVRFRWSAPVGLPVAPLRQLYERSKYFLDEHFASPPASLGMPFFHTGGYFSWMETSEELVQVVVQGFQIIFPCAFTILFLSTGSVLAALYATLTVGLITGSLLGGVKVAFGFALGIGEAIAGNMVIGLSIDYTLHLSHAYMHSAKKDRDSKLADAATLMGTTVLAGAFTTFTSALFMVPCQLTFFTQMCTLIGGTIGFSIVFGTSRHARLQATPHTPARHLTSVPLLTRTRLVGRGSTLLLHAPHGTPRAVWAVKVDLRPHLPFEEEDRRRQQHTAGGQSRCRRERVRDGALNDATSLTRTARACHVAAVGPVPATTSTDGEQVLPRSV